MSSPISGFTAIPNPQMLAFMPIQSYLMMYFAGAGWQIGKRKISAIPNDEFNKMSAKDLLEGFTADLRSTIPTLERSLNDITPLIATLIEQYGEFVKIALATIPKVAHETVTDVFTAQTSKDNTFAQWLRNQFPSAPQGFAEGPRAGGTDQLDLNQDQDRFRPSTIQGKSLLQAREQAKQKQEAHEMLLREKAKSSAQLAKTSQPTPQLRRGFTRKRPAGQSQKMERAKLIQQINALRIRLPQTAMAGRQKTIDDLRRSQQSLVNLLSRYSF